MQPLYPLGKSSSFSPSISTSITFSKYSGHFSSPPSIGGGGNLLSVSRTSSSIRMQYLYREVLFCSHATGIDPGEEFLSHSFWRCAVQIAVFDDDVFVAFPDFAGGVVVHSLGTLAVMSPLHFCEILMFHPLVDDVERSCESRVGTEGEDGALDGEAPLIDKNEHIEPVCLGQSDCNDMEKAVSPVGGRRECSSQLSILQYALVSRQ